MDASTSAWTVRVEDLVAAIEEATRRADSEPRWAAELATVALREADELGDRRARAWGLHLRGWSRFQHGETPQALADQLGAVDLFRELDDQLGLGRAMAAVAPIHDIAGEGAMALSYLEQALDIQRRIGDRWGEARTLNGIAIVLSEDDQQSEEGARLFDEAARIYEELGDRRWYGFAHLNSALTALDRLCSGRVTAARRLPVAEEALGVAREVIDLARSLGAEGSVLRVHAESVAAGALSELGRAEEALDAASRTLLNTDVQPMNQIDLLIVAAKSETAIGRYDDALKHLEQSEMIAEASNRLRMLARVHEERTKVLEALGRTEEALAAHKRFHELDARAKSDSNMARAAAVSALLDVQRSEHELALTKIRLDDLESAARERARLVAAVSHELRSPITSILGLAASVADDWDDLGGDAHELVGLIRIEAQDLADMVDDLLTVSRVSSGAMQVQPTVIQLDEIARDLAGRMSGDDRSIRVEGSARVLADPSRVRQILRNLLSNADRYGGDSIRIACRTDGPVGMVEVCDDGGPIPADDRERVFEPFGQSPAAVRHAQSNGLGLWVARELARRMGGDLEYEHTGSESVFRLTAPSASAG